MERAHSHEECPMTAQQQTSPPSPATPYAPSWMLYVYDEIAYLTFNGRLAATAAYHTSTEQTRINGVYARLTGARITGDRRTRP